MAATWKCLCCLLLFVGCVAAEVSHRRQKRSSVCFPALGCFSNDYPFNNTDSELPRNPRFIQTAFHLYTKEDWDRPHSLDPENSNTLLNSTFDATLPTKLIIHGFMQHAMVSWIRKLTKEFFKREPMNIITVNWSAGSGFPYRVAAANTRVVGAQVALLIQLIKDARHTPNNQFHLIGHSLGAHVAGYAGARLGGLGRITGLDPAEPNFKGTPPAVRLDVGDAAFVDVIHTDGSEFNEVSGYGMMVPIGHIDFYPNGGEFQPGCPRITWYHIIRGTYSYGMEGGEDVVGCNHARSYHYYIESVNSKCRFRAYPCHNASDFAEGRCLTCGDGQCPIMGYDADQFQRTGSFYLLTGASTPFCGNHYHVKIKFSGPMTPVSGAVIFHLVGSKGRSDPIVLNSGATIFSHLQTRHVTHSALANLGDIRGVEVAFERNRGLLSWGRRKSIRVSMVTVLSEETAKLSYFCANDEAVQNGNHITLMNGRTNARGCLRYVYHL